MQYNHCRCIKEKHQKKLDAIIVNKAIRGGIKENPNSIITNLTDVQLTESEASFLKYGLKHGLLTQPKESEMVGIIEDISDQILRNDILKEDHISKHLLEGALKFLTDNYLDVDCKDIGFGRKRTNTFRNIEHKCMISKPDKGQGVVLIKTLRD